MYIVVSLVEFFHTKKGEKTLRPYATVEEWKDKIAEYNIETLGEAGWALETLIDEIIYLKQTGSPA